jgi:hypothetical protein
MIFSLGIGLNNYLLEMVEEIFMNSLELILHIFLHITKLTYILDISENMLISNI